VSQCLSVSVSQCLSVSVSQCLSVSVSQCLSVSVSQCQCHQQYYYFTWGRLGVSAVNCHSHPLANITMGVSAIPRCVVSHKPGEPVCPINQETGDPMCQHVLVLHSLSMMHVLCVISCSSMSAMIHTSTRRLLVEYHMCCQLSAAICHCQLYTAGRLVGVRGGSCVPGSSNTPGDLVVVGWPELLLSLSMGVSAGVAIHLQTQCVSHKPEPGEPVCPIYQETRCVTHIIM